MTHEVAHIIVAQDLVGAMMRIPLRKRHHRMTQEWAYTDGTNLHGEEVVRWK